MPKGADRRALIPAEGRTEYYASLILRAVYRNDSPDGLAFRRGLWDLYGQHSVTIERLRRADPTAACA